VKLKYRTCVHCGARFRGLLALMQHVQAKHVAHADAALALARRPAGE